ncbi:MAG: hypothetical protein QW484_00920 [Candidatus Pacearchaeota archaeon]
MTEQKIEPTNFQECLEEGKAKKVPINSIRAKSLIKSSEQAITTAKTIPLTEVSLKTIFRELYEGLRECCEAIGYMKGYKFLDHISIAFFLRDVLKQESAAKKFDRYRKLRNGINYYGEDININTVKEALEDIPKIIGSLKRYIK